MARSSAGRIIDVSQVAARALGISGLTPVCLNIIWTPEPRQVGGNSLRARPAALRGLAIDGFLPSRLQLLCTSRIRATNIQRLLGQGGTDIAVRLFAFILFCLGVQILWSGGSELLKSIIHAGPPAAASAILK